MEIGKEERELSEHGNGARGVAAGFRSVRKGKTCVARAGFGLWGV